MTTEQFLWVWKKKEEKTQQNWNHTQIWLENFKQMHQKFNKDVYS